MSSFVLVVTRGTEGHQYQQEFTVPYVDGMSLLDGLIWIRDHEDSTLAVRYSCRANACKECSAVMDGRAGYLCAEKAVAGARHVIEPLTKRQWIRDLVSELD